MHNSLKDLILNNYTKERFDIISTGFNNLCLERESLPQINDISGFIKFCQDRNISSVEERISIGEISFCQKNLIYDKVMEFFVGDIQKTITDLLNAKYVVSKDNYLVDGHHRVLASMYLSISHINVVKFLVPVEELLSIGSEFNQ